MLQANQKKIVQAANDNIIQIRELELNFYRLVFSSFGTQAALIAGFTSSFVNVANATCPIFFIYLYWICTSMAFVTAMHVVLSTAFINVYGQGFALRGQLGSMVIAVEGMVEEQEYVVIFFAFSVASFTVASIGQHWIQFTQLGAILCTIVTGTGMFFWYTHLIRIYNRYKIVNPIQRNDDRLVFESRQHAKSDDGPEIIIEGPTVHHGHVKGPVPIPELPHLHYEGYLQSTIGSNSLLGDNWKTSYIVLKDTLLFIYADKKSFDTAPKKPLRKRPIDLDGLTLVTPGSMGFILKPYDPTDERKAIELRCQSVSELTGWIDIITIAIERANTHENLKISNPGSDKEISHSMSDTASESGISVTSNTTLQTISQTITHSASSRTSLPTSHVERRTSTQEGHTTFSPLSVREIGHK